MRSSLKQTMSGATKPRLASRQASPGTMEIERLRYAAEQAAGSQAGPRSPILAATGLDADLAVQMAEKEALINAIRPDESTSALKQTENMTYFMNAARDTGTPESSMCAGTLREAVRVNVPECRGPKLDSPSIARRRHDDSRKERWADLSGCTTDSGSHSDPDNDAVERELLEKRRVAWPRLPR